MVYLKILLHLILELLGLENRAYNYVATSVSADQLMRYIQDNTRKELVYDTHAFREYQSLLLYSSWIVYGRSFDCVFPTINLVIPIASCVILHYNLARCKVFYNDCSSFQP